MKIINADDFGLSLEVNKAIDACFARGLINQTTLLVNMPYTNDAVSRAKRDCYFDKVGLHLNLVEGTPLTESIKHTKLCGIDGCFNENLIRNKLNRFFLDGKTRKAVRLEIEAQMQRYLDYGFTLMHIDSHEHVHTNLSVIVLLIPLLSKYGFKSIRLARNLPLHEMHGMKAAYKYILNFFLQRLNKFSADYSLIHYFGSLTDSELSARDVQNKQELMIHPVMIDGELIDAIYKCNLEKWESKNVLC